jgi:hypothetical protein
VGYIVDAEALGLFFLVFWANAKEDFDVSGIHFRSKIYTGIRIKITIRQLKNFEAMICYR